MIPYMYINQSQGLYWENISNLHITEPSKVHTESPRADILSVGDPEQA